MELLDELGEDITNARLRLRNHSSGYVLGKRPGDHHLVKGVSVVNETLICVIVFFLAAACSHSQSSLHPLTTRRDCCADFLSLSLLTIVDITLIQSY